MTARRRAVLELLVAIAAAAGCVLSWLAAQSTVAVAPVIEGEPMTTSVIYSASAAGAVAHLGDGGRRAGRAGCRAPAACLAPKQNSRSLNPPIRHPRFCFGAEVSLLTVQLEQSAKSVTLFP